MLYTVDNNIFYFIFYISFFSLCCKLAMLYTCNRSKESHLNVPSFLPFVRIMYCKLFWIRTVNIFLFSITLNAMLHHFNTI